MACPETTRKIDSLPANGSMTVLKTKAENGAAGSGARSIGSLRAPAKPWRAGRRVGAGRRAAQRPDADILEARATQHRREFAGDHRRPQRRAQLIVLQHALVEILLEQRVVGLGHGLA